MHLILVVEDDAALAHSLCNYLRHFRLKAQAVAGTAALAQQLAMGGADLVVLSTELALDDRLRQASLRCAAAGLPCILVTAADTAAQRAAAHVDALAYGAADAMTRPFDPRELVARIRSVLRRTAPHAEQSAPSSQPQELAFAGWRLRTGDGALTSPGGEAVALSSAEYRLLTTFLLAPQRVMSREQLGSLARGDEAPGAGRRVDLLVSRLRHKLRDGTATGPACLIKTVRGAGYLFNARPDGRDAPRHG